MARASFSHEQRLERERFQLGAEQRGKTILEWPAPILAKRDLAKVAVHVLAADLVPPADDGALEHRMHALSPVDVCLEASALIGADRLASRMVDLNVATLLAPDRNVCGQLVGHDDRGRIDPSMNQRPKVSCSVREDRTEPEEPATRDGGERYRLVGAAPGLAFALPISLLGWPLGLGHH